MKLLIIDDESIIRNGLQQYINWNSLGIEQVQTAADGKAALDIIEHLEPHIILSDIKMPTMDGIELIKTLHEKSIKSKVIFMSAYSDFAYTQQAIHFGAFDYILKPIEEDKLIDIVKKCIAEIQQKQTEAERFQKNQEEHLKTLLLMHIYNNGKIVETDMKKLTAFHLLPADYHYLMAAVVIADKNTPVNSPEFTGVYYDDSVKKQPAITTLEITISNNELILLFFTAQGTLTAFYDEVTNLMSNSFLPQTPASGQRIGFSSAYQAGISFFQLYLEASSSLFIDKSSTQSLPHKLDYPELLKLVKNGSLSDVIRYINCNFLLCTNRSSFNNLTTLKLEYINCLQYLLNNIPEQSIKSLIYKKIPSLQVKDTISSLYSLYQMHNTFITIVTTIANCIVETQFMTKNKLVKLALEYIHTRYSCDLSLNKAATELFVSPSYLSKIFSDEIGENFSRYLIKYRIEKAKELLLNPKYKIYEVANQVGYSDLGYFTKIFKELENVTPTAFRNLN